MPNGFLGVDIFFVLSGFLITSIIYREVHSGSFYFREFYIRRIKRILPVFFVVVATCFGLAYWLYLPKDAVSVGKSAVGAILFVSNILFARHSGYFDVSSEEKPLLHIWSLSIEEQFYFIFPSIILLLWGLYKKIYKHTEKEKAHRFFIIILCTLTFLSFLFSFVPIQINDVNLSMYYLPQIRFGELLVGSILAIVMSRETECNNILRRKQASIMGNLSLFVLFTSLYIPYIFSAPWFPGFASLIPCIATAMMIYYNRQSYWISRIFSSPILVWIGRISYSLYLWHWPILAFIRYFWGTGVLPTWLNLIAGICMLTLSTLTYYTVELPIRKREYSFIQAFSFFYAIPAAIIIGVFLLKKDFHPIAPEYAGFIEDGSCCFNTIEGDCIVGSKNIAPQVLIVGDSHTAQLSRFWHTVAHAEGWSAFVSASISCPFFFNYDNYMAWQEEDNCVSRNNFIREVYHEYPIIVLANYWGTIDYAHNKEFIPNLSQTIEKLTQEGKKVYIVNSSYQVNTPPVREYYASLKGVNLNLSKFNRNPQGSYYEKTKKNAQKIEDFVKKHHPEVKWIDIEPYIPSNLTINGLPMMGDAHHLNAYGAQMIANLFISQQRLIDPIDLNSTSL